MIIPVGYPITRALWYNAEVTGELDAAVRGIERELEYIAEAANIILSDIVWENVDPLSPRVPDPPEHMNGGVRALIGTATVKAHGLEIPESNFTDDLTAFDLADLRKATRNAFRDNGGEFLTDEECDQIINDNGPDVAGAEIMRRQ